MAAIVLLLVFSGALWAQGNSDNAFERVREVQERHTEKLMAKDGVAGTAVGLGSNGTRAILVLLERSDVPEIPANLEGVPVQSVVTGAFHALSSKLAQPRKPSKPSRDKTPPTVPTGLTTTTITSTAIGLDWNDNSDADLSYYNVYRSTFEAGPYGRVASNVIASEYNDGGLAPLVTYYYAITAVDTAGNESAKSGVVSATTLDGPMPELWCKRPVPIGVSTGHPNITAGTIGCRVTKNGAVYALSNNHVYADENRAAIGDNVLQPGVYDEGVNPRDAIGTLAQFKSIVFSRQASNTIDAAIALCSVDTLGSGTPNGGYGTPSRTLTTATLDMHVKKYGRTTGLTHGQVYALNAIINVGYDAGTARFVNQIVITPGDFSAGGDSGSLIVTDDTTNSPVALLFAGSSLYTIANPIGAVVDYFGVAIDGK